MLSKEAAETSLAIGCHSVGSVRYLDEKKRVKYCAVNMAECRVVNRCTLLIKKVLEVPYVKVARV